MSKELKLRHYLIVVDNKLHKPQSVKYIVAYSKEEAIKIINKALKNPIILDVVCFRKKWDYHMSMEECYAREKEMGWLDD